MQGQNRVGQKLGNYRLVKLLGKGGYSEVYLAENIHLGVQTAIKVLKLRDLDDLEQEKFRAEAKFMTTLEHPRIIKVLDYGIEMGQQIDGSTPYIVMEYAPLGTLRHMYPHRTAMPLQKVASYTLQISEALQYAHDKNIIHLDVKPENMLVRKPDDAALSDFGIAVSGLNTNNLQLQQAEILRKMARGEPINIPGTAPYLAPERLQGHTQRSSDQYSLAVVVYEWLTGKRPFEGSDLEICLKHEKEPPPPLAGTYSYISPEIEQVVQKGLAKLPSNRYKSVHDFAVALDQAIQAARPANPVPPVFKPSMPSMPGAHNPYPLSPGSPMTPIPPTPAPNPNPLPPTTPMQQPPWVGQQTVYPNNSTPPTSTPPGFTQPTPSSSNMGNGANPQWQWQRQQAFDYDDHTVEDLPPGVKRPAPPPKDIPARLEEFFDNPGTVTREMFVADKYFPKTQRTRMFRMIGTPANILSALIVLVAGPLPLSILPALIGGTLSVAMLWRCTVTVKKPVAIAFGTGVALWWGIAALLVTQHASPVLSFLGFVFALGISLAIHVWYVNTRLKR